MDWNDTKSSMMKRFRYDPEKKELEIEFPDGRFYSYEGINQDVIDELLDPKQSSGKTFHTKIRGKEKKMERPV